MAATPSAVVRNEGLKPRHLGLQADTADAREPTPAITSAAAQPIGLLLFHPDIQAAMDRVERATGTDRFVIFGACSDAVNAFQAASADERVIGLAVFDGFCPCSRWNHVVRTWKRLRATPWRELFDPLREVFLRQARELVACDVRVYFPCSGGCAKPLGDIEICLLEHLDHTIISLDVEKEVREIVVT